MITGNSATRGLLSLYEKEWRGGTRVEVLSLLDL